MRKQKEAGILPQSVCISQLFCINQPIRSACRPDRPGRYNSRMFQNQATQPSRQSVWPVRVYYEDTDAGGVVYYANYLRFCERARTERLRTLGIDQRALRAAHGILFVVRRVEADYLRAAELDDELQVISSVVDIGAASLKFEQHVVRGEQCLFSATVSIVCLDAERWRATRIPDFLRTLFESEA